MYALQWEEGVFHDSLKLHCLHEGKGYETSKV
jgi:hypothetical protein